MGANPKDRSAKKTRELSPAEAQEIVQRAEMISREDELFSDVDQADDQAAVMTGGKPLDERSTKKRFRTPEEGPISARPVPSAVLRKWLLPVLLVLLVAGLGIGAWALWPASSPGDQGEDVVVPVVAASPAPVVREAPAPLPENPGPEDSLGEKPEEKPREKKVAARVAPRRRKPKAPHKLNRKAVERLLRRQARDFENCAIGYLKKRGAGSKVKLTLKFEIGSNGLPRAVRLVPKSLESTSLGSCLLAHVRGLRFPRHRDKGASISFPLEFEAGSE